MSDIYVVGEPVLSGGRGQDEWQSRIAARLTGRIDSPSLTFVVASLKRHGQVFDLDNLIPPVLMMLEPPIDAVHARLYVGEPSGLLIRDQVFRQPAGAERTLYVDFHSMKSARDRIGIPGIAGDSALDEHDGIGLSLEFDRDDIPIRQGWFGPTEAVVDDLSPWLGRYTSRQLVADHRIREIHFSRSNNPGREGVKISAWYVPDGALAVPVFLSTELASRQDR